MLSVRDLVASLFMDLQGCLGNPLHSNASLLQEDQFLPRSRRTNVITDVVLYFTSLKELLGKWNVTHLINAISQNNSVRSWLSKQTAWRSELKSFAGRNDRVFSEQVKLKEASKTKCRYTTCGPTLIERRGQEFKWCHPCTGQPGVLAVFPSVRKMYFHWALLLKP